MRVGTVLTILIVVNVLWAAAFFGYVKRSTTPVVSKGGSVAAPPALSNSTAAATGPKQGAAPTNSTANIASTPASATNVLPAAAYQYGWRDVTNEIYTRYITKLRAAGCPEKQVRNIVVSDVNELFDQRRLEHAIKTDSQWWKAETYMGVLPMQNFAGINFDDQRRELLTKILGEEAADSVKLSTLNGSAVNLTGPVLGALPADAWNTVQEICSRSMERHQAYQMARMNEGAAMDNVELAKLRDQTRTELSKMLTTEQIEEFLLRFSHNASKLRQDMRGMDLTPDEFRKIFRATDPLEHQTQVEYGGPEALSQKQRDQLEAQRDRAVRETLSPDRYAQYVGTKDPLYKQAQLMAMQYNMNARAVKALYDMQKSLDAKRTQVTQDAAMTAEQRAQALQSISVEHQQTLQRLLGDPAYRN
ncbi:MAG TPA: hypothetical protein VK846_04035 [Candidatus Limnocylindria bacterium]|nr:hypothetical protein [Candidatus Limnocylindria bacterium]